MSIRLSEEEEKSDKMFNLSDEGGDENNGKKVLKPKRTRRISKLEKKKVSA